MNAVHVQTSFRNGTHSDFGNVRLIFTKDRVGAGVVIKSIELYDLVQTALWVLWLGLRLCHLRSSENWVVGVASRNKRTKPITTCGNVYCDWFIFPLLLLTLTIWFEWFSYDLEKWFRWVFAICFISQWMKRSKHALFVFPPKKTLIWRRHCSIGQSCCSMTSKRSIDWFLESSWAWCFFTRVFA